MYHILATSLALDNDGSDGSEETTLAISEGTHCATQQRGGDCRLDILKRSFEVFVHEYETVTAESALTIATQAEKIARLEEDNAVQKEEYTCLHEKNNRLAACVEDTARFEKQAQLKRKQQKEMYEQEATAELIKLEAKSDESTEENILLKKELAELKQAMTEFIKLEATLDESIEKNILLEKEVAQSKQFLDAVRSLSKCR